MGETKHEAVDAVLKPKEKSPLFQEAIDRLGKKPDPYYVITDDGKAVRYPLEMPKDFGDYIDATNDWGMSHPGEERPGYDDWKKSQDPDYEPDDGSIEVPPEILEALEGAAGKTGMEPPYSVRIDRESYPELFDKFEELSGRPVLFDPEAQSEDNGLKVPEWGDFDGPWHNTDPGFNPKGTPGFGEGPLGPVEMPNFIVPEGSGQGIGNWLHPEEMPMFKLPEGWEPKTIDPSTLPYIDPLFRPEAGVLGPETDPDFIEVLKGELDGVDIDAAFDPYIPDAPSADAIAVTSPEPVPDRVAACTFGLSDLVADGTDPAYESGGPNGTNPAVEAVTTPEPEKEENVIGCDFGML